MIPCFFVSDLHGSKNRYDKLFAKIRQERPSAVFFGGDLLPNPHSKKNDFDGPEDFVRNYLEKNFADLKDELSDEYPLVAIILGNDDPKAIEPLFLEVDERGVWKYLNQNSVEFGAYKIFGYPYVPPTPFLFKDWEKYDVSRYVDPGCVPPTEGYRFEKVPRNVIEHVYIKDDLEELAGDEDLSRAIFLFHSPPHDTNLDRAALDGKTIESVPLDPRVGSIAIRRFIEKRMPLLTLHGHIHESSKLTEDFRHRFESTLALSAAYHGRKLALVRFDLEDLSGASRELI